MNRLTDVVKNLLIINVIAFIGIQTLPDVFKEYGELGSLYYFQSPKFQPFQIVTSMFMHANFMHLLINMLGLFFLGPMVESALGGKRFFILYILSGLVASICQIGIHYFEFFSFANSHDEQTVSLLLNEGIGFLDDGKNYVDPYMADLNVQLYRIFNYGVKGASGCIYGVVIAFATMFPNLKLTLFPIPIQVPAKIIGIFSVGMALYSGLTGNDPGIGHFAHLGGALTGFLMIHYWKMANLR